MHHSPEPETLNAEALAVVTGGFMQHVQQAMGLAGNLVNQYGDDEAKQGFGTASNIVGSALGG